MNIRVGDYVRLAAREQPFAVPATAWWQVIEQDDRGLDCVHWLGEKVDARREGIPMSAVLAHRRPNEAA